MIDVIALFEENPLLLLLVTFAIVLVGAAHPGLARLAAALERRKRLRRRR